MSSESRVAAFAVEVVEYMLPSFMDEAAEEDEEAVAEPGRRFDDDGPLPDIAVRGGVD